MKEATYRFATDGPNSGVRTPYGNIGHVGIALSPTLFIHSSSQGVAIGRWDQGWHAQSFAFGKHVLPA